MGRDEDWQSIIRFWGKTLPPSLPTESTTSFKPVLHHLLDVAAVALVAQCVAEERLKRAAGILRVEPNTLARTSAFLAGLHDLGKFSRSFQALQPDLWPLAPLGPFRPVAPLPHWRASALLLNAEPVAAALDPFLPRLAGSRRAPIIATVAGHHGRPPPEREATAHPDEARRHPAIGPVCVEAAATVTRLLGQMVMPEPLGALRGTMARRWSWQLSGLITFADWIGSDVSFFAFLPLEMDPGEYWLRACRAAEEALAAKGLVAPPPCRVPSLARIAPVAAASPRPLQSEAEHVPLPDGPVLAVIEDVTGAGKTEAAAVLAARMMVAGKGEGLYFALPTEATANAMHQRLAAFYRAMFEGGAPSLVLAHGHARQSPAFLKTVPLENGGSDYEDAAEGAVCSAWIADDRRKAFFADVGAGTIDQAFLAVLPKRHLTLRQYGLAGRVLVVDEAHSFDAYMSQALATLLRLHAMQGGSAIVLSATLAAAQRQALIDAFCEGLSAGSAVAASEAYPLLTLASAKGVSAVLIAPSTDLERSVSVKRLDDRAAALNVALSLAAEKGAAVLVLVNAVDEAIAVHDALAAVAPEPEKVHLFHARFAQADRQRIEAQVLDRFGRDGPEHGRAGHILVATQVVEQSLDVDFDALISDLAPIDLLVQRAGRIWRHLGRRPAASRALPAPVLYLVSPDPETAGNADWLRPALGKAAYVYRHAGIMWRSANVLLDEGSIVSPGRLRRLIESVYASDAVPECLAAAQLAGEGLARAEGEMGRFNVVRLGDGYAGLPSDLRSDEEIGTRLGEPTVMLRLARREDGLVIPWAQADTRVRAWALSELRVRAGFLRGATPLSDPAAVAARCDWPEWDAGVLLAVAEADGSLALSGPAGDRFIYDARRGLVRVSEDVRQSVEGNR